MASAFCVRICVARNSWRAESTSIKPVPNPAYNDTVATARMHTEIMTSASVNAPCKRKSASWPKQVDRVMLSAHLSFILVPENQHQPRQRRLFSPGCKLNEHP